MRIGIDAHALGTAAGGNETYMRELLCALRDLPAARGATCALVGRHLPADDPDVAWCQRATLPFHSSYVRVPIALPWMALRHKLDVLHVQYNAPLYAPCPVIVSVHDIVWKRHPESLRAVDRLRLNALIPGTLRRARRVFVLTEAIRRELTEVYGVPPERMDLVQPGVDPAFRPVTDEETRARVRQRYGVPEQYILYLGALQPRKNLARLAQAFAQLAKEGLPHNLVITGKRAWLYGPILAEIEALGLGDRIRFTGYVDRQDLPALLSGAAAFAYVSIYEGFGLPVLEAMACGAPVVASTDPAILEVAGEAARPCDPLDAADIRAALCAVLTDSALAQRLREAGPRQAALFTRARMAQSAWRGYEAALA